jgi:hypothetical protein
MAAPGHQRLDARVATAKTISWQVLRGKPIVGAVLPDGCGTIIQFLRDVMNWFSD